MSFTVKELESALTQWEEQIGENRNLFMDMWYEENMEGLPNLEGIGQLEFVDSGGGEGDGAEIWVVIKIGNRYFRKTGYYSSWGSDEMDGDLEEVKPKQVEVTQYEAI